MAVFVSADLLRDKFSFPMTKTPLSLTALVLFAVAPLSFARLGETLDQCKTRYGGQTGQYGDGEFRFRRDHMVITVHLRATDRCERILGLKPAVCFQKRRSPRFCKKTPRVQAGR